LTNKAEYKEALSAVDRNIRLCLLYLESVIEEKFTLALQVKQPSTPKVDFSRLESRDDSLQKQIDGLRVKVDLAQELVKDHEDQEKYLKNLTKDAEEVLNGMIEHFKELYDSGYDREGMKRKFREEGLIRKKTE